MRTTGVLPTVSRMLAYLAMGISLFAPIHLIGGVLISGKLEDRKAALSSLRHPGAPKPSLT
jgi:hypothetical protein